MRWTALAWAAIMLMVGMNANTAAHSVGETEWTSQELVWRGASPKGTPLRSTDRAAEKPEEGFQPETERETLELQNQLRMRLGLRSLALDENLRQAAYIRAKELAENGYFAHSRPDGAEWHTVLREDVPTTFSAAGENLAEVSYSGDIEELGFSGAYWTSQWENSPSHRKLMTAGEYSRAGVAVYYTWREGVHHVCAVTLYAK